jgi:hypothetical protein
MAYDDNHTDDSWGWPVALLLLVLALIGAVAIGGGVVLYRQRMQRVLALLQEAEHSAWRVEKLRAAEARSKTSATPSRPDSARRRSMVREMAGALMRRRADFQRDGRQRPGFCQSF